MSPKADVGPSLLHVVRIDPKVAKIEIGTASAIGGGNRTARGWCEDLRAVAAINAGMYDADHSTHTGYLRVGDRVQNPRWASSYQSLFVLDPALGAAILDREDAGELAKLGAVVQNLRLIRKSTRKSVWQKTEKRWSEAALAEDGKGRILFLFSRSPYAMDRFNAILASLPLDIVTAQHAEGGPEASLSICVGERPVHLSGSYETGFNENDDNAAQWRIPNVIVAISR
jgi:hypothetical protein